MRKPAGTHGNRATSAPSASHRPPLENERYVGFARAWLGGAVALLGALSLNILANLIAGWFPDMFESHPWLRSVAPWIIVIALWIYLLYKYTHILHLKKWLGIENATGLLGYIKRLAGSGYHPSECMDRVSVCLDFMGHSASKWTKDRELLGEMLRRTYGNGGQVRFLLLDPKSEACREASQVFKGSSDDQARRILESLMVLKDVVPRFKHMQVRLYSHRPQFRLTFDDRETLSVGHYMGYRRGSEDTPLLVCNRKADWSFYTAFLTYFEDEWDRASEVDWAAVENLH